MSSMFPNGTQYAISAALLAAIPITALTNANPPVASSTSAPPVDGSVIVLNSGWSSISDAVAVTSGADTQAKTFKLANLNTLDVGAFPAGLGIGSAQVVSGWVALDQVANVASSGGDQQYYQYQYVEDTSGRQRQKPTVKNPLTVTLTQDYDPDKPWYAALIAADRAKKPVVLRATLPSGDTMYYVAFPSFNEVPTQNVNQNMQNVATFSLLNAPVRVKAAA